MRDSLGTGAYFGTYESCKYLITPKDTQPNAAIHLMSGGLSGIICWLVVFPIDLVKSIVQKEALSAPESGRETAMQVASTIWKSGGVGGFYKGIGIVLLRAIPIHGVR